LRLRTHRVDIGIQGAESQSQIAIFLLENFDAQSARAKRSEAETVASSRGGFDFDKAAEHIAPGANAIAA
jgi:hypothetical protein